MGKIRNFSSPALKRAWISASRGLGFLQKGQFKRDSIKIEMSFEALIEELFMRIFQPFRVIAENEDARRSLFCLCCVIKIDDSTAVRGGRKPFKVFSYSQANF